jgi:hypothetical protein
MAAISKTPSGSYRGVFTSQPLDTVVDVLNGLTGNGTPQPLTATTETISGYLTLVPQTLTAVGSTQGGAAAITSTMAIVTVATTVSTKGVRLPAASTGLEVWVANAATFGCKVYPAAGGKIGAASTNVADTTLAINKANQYIAVNKTLWVVQRGA